MTITLAQGVEFCRWLESKLIPEKAHCSLGGSVLHKGESQHDVDVFIYPHNEANPKTASELENIVLKIFPGARLVTDLNYPHDRLLYRVEMYGWRIELFIFVNH